MFYDSLFYLGDEEGFLLFFCYMVENWAHYRKISLMNETYHGHVLNKIGKSLNPNLNSSSEIGWKGEKKHFAQLSH